MKDWNEFMKTRARWLEVALVPTKYETGTDVVIRIDGAYYQKTPDELAEIKAYFQDETKDLIDGSKK